MKQYEPDKPINDDILKCREDILRAGGLDPEASKPAPRKIPSFEEMISKQTEPVETETPEEIPAVEDVPDQFAVVEITSGTRQILDARYITPPSFSLITLPRWIRENDIDIILAGGMDQHAQELFIQNHIEC